MEISERFQGCLFGLAAGDALGTTLEFQARGSFAPLVDMIGGGPFHLQPGQWTDDTSLALCLAASLVERQEFDPRDQMERYCRWQEQGYMSSTGRCFDIGIATSSALSRYRASGEPFSGSSDPYSAGNGSLMRLAPVALFFYPDRAQAVFYAGESSRTTHAATECIDACRLYVGMLCRALDGADKEAILFGDADFQGAPRIQAIARGEYGTLPVEQVQGSGYVVHSLEAALWCFLHSGGFAEAVLKAANLGDDADTTAAICGQIAGAYYGLSGIPRRWLEMLSLRDEIARLAVALQRPGPADA